MSDMKLKQNPMAGVWFWFKWIIASIVSFAASIWLWYFLLIERLGSSFHQPRIAIGWITIVFGTWFIMLMFLMNRKEKVTGRTDQQKEATLGWWLTWIGLTLGTFFLAVWFWTPFIAKRLGSIRQPGVTLIWVFAVFGTWLIALIPLMTFMYQKVDQLYEARRIQRQKLAEQRENNPGQEDLKIKTAAVEEPKRRLPKNLSAALKKIPPTLNNGHLVTLALKDGRKIENVFIAGRKNILGLYDRETFDFTADDITDIEPTDLTHPPDFTQKTWLRLDSAAV